MNKISILIADDHKIVRMGLKSLFSSEKDITVVGEADDGVACIQQALKLHPDVIIMDLMMPKMNGAEATKAILESNPEIKIIVLTSFGASVEMAKAIQAGAAGALLKESPSEELIKAIFAVMNGETAIHSEVSEYIDELECQPELTQRQLEILTAIAAGNTDKAIADEFKISIAGVRKHLLAITSKLGACSRTEAVSIALRKRLLKL